MKAISTNKDEPKFEGPHLDYYENGNIKQESNYVDNKLNGKQIDWYENSVKKSEKEIVWDSKTSNYITKILQFWDSNGVQKVTDGNGDYEEKAGNEYSNGEVKNGIKDGIWEGSFKKEKFSYKEVYKEGKLISGESIVLAP